MIYGFGDRYTNRCTTPLRTTRKTRGYDYFITFPAKWSQNDTKLNYQVRAGEFLKSLMPNFTLILINYDMIRVMVIKRGKYAFASFVFSPASSV